jgi:hypothetical protein
MTFASERAAWTGPRGLPPVGRLPVLAVDTGFDELQDRIPIERKVLGERLPDEPQPIGLVHKGAMRAAPI